MTTAPCWARVDGPLAPYADGFRAELERLGYTPLTAAVHMRPMGDLSRWLPTGGTGGAGDTSGGRTPRTEGRARKGGEAPGLPPAVVVRSLPEPRAAA